MLADVDAESLGRQTTESLNAVVQPTCRSVKSSTASAQGLPSDGNVGHAGSQARQEPAPSGRHPGAGKPQGRLQWEELIPTWDETRESRQKSKLLSNNTLLTRAPLVAILSLSGLTFCQEWSQCLCPPPRSLTQTNFASSMTTRMAYTH